MGSAATLATTAITTGDHKLKETGVHTTSKAQSDHELLFDTEHLPMVNTLEHGTQPTTDDKYFIYSTHHLGTCTLYTITANYYTNYTNTNTTTHTLHVTTHTHTHLHTTHVLHVTHTTLHTPSVTSHTHTHTHIHTLHYTLHNTFDHTDTTSVSLDKRQHKTRLHP